MKRQRRVFEFSTARKLVNKENQNDDIITEHVQCELVIDNEINEQVMEFS